MPDSRQPSRSRLVRHTVLAGVLFAALGQVASAQTARVGHARMVSASGQPLAVELTVRGLAPEQRDMTVSAAPSPAWIQAGLTPPVALESLSFQVVPGPVATSQVVRVRSDQVFHGDIADLLVNIQTGSGQLQHQVSVMAPDARSPSVALVAVQQGGGDAVTTSTSPAAASAPTGDDVSVRRGDTLFSIARSQAVPGVSVYQMMMALQAVNPQAFIDGNVNRLKAGATLRLPSADELSVLSDAQARRLFAEQGEAFAAYRERIAGLRGDAVSADASRGQIGQAQASTAPADAGQSRDQLVLSSGNEATASADDKAAADKNIADSRGRISELEQNVADLNQAIGGQGAAAAANGNAATGDNGASGTGQGQSDSAGLASASAQTSATQTQAASSADSAASDAAQPKSWWQENMLGIVTGLLALLVLLVVWLLRRAGVNRGEAERGSPITEDMVKQKLEEINLDFQNDTDSKPRSGGPSV